jgi:hypothetical protein
MRFLLRVLMLAASMLVATPFAQATIVNYTATLSGSNEAIPTGSLGTGLALVTMDDLLNTMSINLTFSGLSGTTTASHIHCCTGAPSSGTAGVATIAPFFPGFPIGVTAGSYANTFDLTLASSYNSSFVTAHGGTLASAEAFLLIGMSSGEAYFNIHTNQFPGGEIRGFLIPTQTQVPEPTSLLLIGIALAGLGLSRRKQGIG